MLPWLIFVFLTGCVLATTFRFFVLIPTMTAAWPLTVLAAAGAGYSATQSALLGVAAAFLLQGGYMTTLLTRYVMGTLRRTPAESGTRGHSARPLG